MDGLVSSWAEIGGCFSFVSHSLWRISQRPMRCLFVIDEGKPFNWAVLARWWHTVVLYTFPLYAAVEWFRGGSFRELRLICTGTRRIVRICMGLFLNISHRFTKSIAFNLMFLLNSMPISVDMIVMGRAWQHEVLLLLVRIIVLTPTCSPGRYLCTLCCPMPCLNWVSESVIARTRAINFLGLQVRFWTKRGIETASIGLCSGEEAPIIESWAELVGWASCTYACLDLILIGCRVIHVWTRLLCLLGWRYRFLIRIRFDLQKKVRSVKFLNFWNKRLINSSRNS